MPEETTDNLTNEQKLMVQLGQLRDEFRRLKPNDKSDKDRVYAIAITEAEKLLGYWMLWAVIGEANMPKVGDPE